MKIIDFILQQRNTIIFIFQTIKVILIGTIATLFAVGWVNPDLLGIVSRFGMQMGELSVCFLMAALTPGILRRFNTLLIFNRLIMPFRRQLGIMMYLLALGHYFLNTLLFELLARELFTHYELFMWFGLMALLLTTPLFLTSNNWSVQRLGKQWGRLHKLVYAALLFVLLHLSLQQSNWVIVSGLYLALEALSYIVFWVRKKKGPVTGP